MNSDSEAAAQLAICNAALHNLIIPVATLDDTPVDPAPTINWDDFHSDPVLDVVIKSSDNVHFRASSHALKRESSLFSGMLTTIPNQHMSPADAVPLDYTASAIRLFLDRYATPITLDYLTTDFESLHEHVKLIYHLDCDRLIPHVRKAYDTVCAAKPFLLVLASSRDNNPTIASRALTRCASTGEALNAANVFDIISKVRKTWQLPLLKSLLVHSVAHNGYYHGIPGGNASFTVSWPNVQKAEQFVKDVHEAEKAGS